MSDDKLSGQLSIQRMEAISYHQFNCIPMHTWNMVQLEWEEIKGELVTDTTIISTASKFIIY